MTGTATLALCMRADLLTASGGQPDSASDADVGEVVATTGAAVPRVLRSGRDTAQYSHACTGCEGSVLCRLVQPAGAGSRDGRH